MNAFSTQKNDLFTFKSITMMINAEEPGELRDERERERDRARQ